MSFSAIAAAAGRASVISTRAVPAVAFKSSTALPNRSMWTTASIASRFDQIAGLPNSLPSTHSATDVQTLRWDPLRSARTGVLRTLGKMGWPINKNETITEGVKGFATLKHMYLVIDVVPEDSYIVGTNVLKPEVQSHYDMIRAKGWKVVLVNQRAWNKVALKSRTETNGESRAYARARFLINLVTDQAPFETRRDAELVSANDYGVYDKMKKAAAKHGSQYGIAGIVRGKGRVRMRVRRNRS